MITLDSTTRTEYLAETTLADRAQAVLDALEDPVTIVVYDGETEMGSGTMATPWATRNTGVLTTGEVTSFAVTSSGTPGAGWTLRFESGSRWIRGTFGLTGSGSDFEWSLPTWSAGQSGRISTIVINATDEGLTLITGSGTIALGEVTIAGTGTISAGNIWSGSDPIALGNYAEGSAHNVDLTDYLSDPGDAALYTYERTGSGSDTASSGITVNASTGVLTIPDDATVASYQIEVEAIPVSVELTTLTLTGGGSGKPWTFGHAFKQGDVPTGYYITATGPTSFQAEVRNRWADGSVKFAVLSGVGGTSAVLSATYGTAPTGSVTEPTTTASVEFSSPATTVQLATARTNGSMSWDKTTAHKVREILGPVMSEYHYYSPVSGDNHLAVWWYVRAYTGGAVEVETVVENGWLNVASPTSKSYTATVTVNGTERYSGALTHLHHTRWGRGDWSGTDPAITPSHSSSYLRSTKLVPNYTTAYGAPSSTVLNGLSQPTAPFSQGSWPSDMGAAGGGGRLLNNWEALYVTSGDYRAYNSTIANSRAAGRYGIHYRDENTGEPPSYTTHSTKVYGSNSGISDCSNDGTSLPSNGGAAPPNYAKSHALPFGYLPYLVTGRHSFRDQVEFQANVPFFAAATADSFESQRIVKATSGAATELRGAGWALRGIANAVVCVPDDNARAAQYKTHLAKTLGYYGDNYTDENNLGVIQNYETYVSGTTTYKNFMEDAFSIGCGWAWQVANEQLGSDKSRADGFVTWRMKQIVGRMGNQSGYCYRDAATYAVKYADSDYSGSAVATFNSGVYSSWATVYAETFGANTCDSSTALNGDSGDDPDLMSTSDNTYWGLVHTALALAVDIGATGATTSWSRLIGASNYDPSGFNDMVVWGVVPR